MQKMDSEDEDAIYGDEHEDSYNESGSEEGDESDFDIDCDEPSTPKRPHVNDDFHYECPVSYTHLTLPTKLEV